MVSLFLLGFLTTSCEITSPPKRKSELDPRFLAKRGREGAWAGSGGFQRAVEPGCGRRLRVARTPGQRGRIGRDRPFAWTGRKQA